MSAYQRRDITYICHAKAKRRFFFQKAKQSNCAPRAKAKLNEHKNVQPKILPNSKVNFKFRHATEWVLGGMLRRAVR